MPASEEKFEILYNDKNVLIQVVRNAGQTVYIAKIEGSAPLFLTRAKNAEGAHFWTSVPEGRQKQAEEIGRLIQEYIISQQ